MAQSTRQTNLLVQQDWTKIYQTFTNADFTSYDFETLRASMIKYLKTYYPETFNDFLESSEYLALIDMLAFLGQSLSFRTDLNARENFLDTAQRRDSILKLARMLAYNPQRTNSASGLLKIESVSTTESITDSNGFNLSNAVVHWNDSTNDNWLEQFNSILNASLITGQAIGKPGNSQAINNIQTDEYSIALNPNTLPIAQFASSIKGTTTVFEAVSATTVGENYVYEASPTRAGRFNILYRNDNNGNGSNNTGFFVYFKQGSLQSTTFNIQNSIPNNYVSINSNNINNTDAWLYKLNVNNVPQDLWTAVPALSGINVTYNNQSDKNLYQVNTRNGDQIDLVFGDGNFSNIPQGSFRFYYRTSNGATYSITPDDMASVTVAFPYVNAKGAIETISITASLHYTVTNATSAQSLASIKAAAPQQYYTQNRMITGEDYNIFPQTSFSGIQKIKAINRTSSGVSLYLDALDPTGSYSSTNIFGDDGIIAFDSGDGNAVFDFLTSNDIYSTIYNEIIPLINSTEMRNYYYANFAKYSAIDSVPWTANTTFAANTFVQFNGSDYKVLGNAYAPNIPWTGNTSFPTGSNVYYSGNSYITTGNTRGYSFTWANIQSNVTLLWSGTNSGFNTAKANLSISNGLTFNQTGNTTSHSYGNLTYANITQNVNTATTGNLKYVAPGALIKVTAPTGSHFDSNHAIVSGTTLGSTDTLSYYAAVSGVVSSTDYYTPNLVKFATIVPTGAVVNFASITPTYKNDISNSLIATLVTQAQSHVNFGLKYDQVNQVWANIPPSQIGTSSDWMLKFIYHQGLYTVTYRKLSYSFSSAGNTKFYYDPLTRVYSSATGTNISDTIKILKINTKPNLSTPLMQDQIWQVYNTVVQNDGYTDNSTIYIKIPETQIEGVPSNPDLYATVASTSTSRDQLYFQYTHNVPSRSRIDPTPINIIDLYVLNADYSKNYISWLRDLTGMVSEPTTPTSTSLESAYRGLDNYKAVSDTVIYNPAKFKPLFGTKADPSLQARFQVVKNPAIGITDNEIKSQVIAAINVYFDIANWDFGDTFYFSELAAYLHSTLAPNISSILIVPKDTSLVFGNFFQINAEPWEIITSAATVNDVEIISAVTAASLNLGNTLVDGGA